MDAYQDQVIDLDELRERRDAIRRQIAAISRQSDEPEQEATFNLADFAAKVVRGAFRLKRLTDAKEKKAIIHSLFSMILIKGDAISAFKFRDDFGGGNGAIDPIIANAPIELGTPFRASAPEEPTQDGYRRCSCCKHPRPLIEFYAKRGMCVGERAIYCNWVISSE